MFFPAVKKGTIDSYIIFPRCPLIFRLDFCRILTYNILHHLNEILWIKGKGHENIV